MREFRLLLFHDPLEYRFCGPPTPEARRPVTLESLLAQAREIDISTTERVSLSGGSPLEHPKFPELVKRLRAAGLKHFALETDSRPLAVSGLLPKLHATGFEELFVIQENATDLDGVRAAIESELKTYVVVPVSRANVEAIDPLLDALLKSGKPDGFLLAVPEIARVPIAAREMLLKQSEVAELAARVFRKAQGNNVEYGFASKRGVTPCAAHGALDHFATVFHDRMNFFKHAKDEKLARVAACADCSLTNSCNGIEVDYVRAFGESELQPIPLDVSMDWKLRRINKLESADYRHVSPFTNDSLANPRGLLRINGHCNMSCAFCFVDRTAPDFAADEMRAEIARMRSGGSRHLVLSGGEPTLHPELPSLIAFAKTQGFHTIEMQSNGVKCADLDYARTLVETGLNKVTVSLHSADAEHSDTITRLPKAFPKTIQAIHNFRRLGINTQIAHVITKANYKELPGTMQFLASEFPTSEAPLSICLAIAQGISDLVYHWVIPTFSEIKPFVRESLDYCLATGMTFGGMIGQGGYPPCMLDGELKYYAEVIDQIYKSDDSSEQFYKPAACKECDFNSHCLGPRRSYVEHFGDAEIKPFRTNFPLPAVAAVPAPDRAGHRLPVMSR